MRGRENPADYTHLSDMAVLEAVFGKDERAWRELLRRFRPLVYRCINKVACRYDALLTSEDVNEIFGEVCFNLLRDDMRKLRAWDPTRGSKLGSWLGLIAMNTAYDFLRGRDAHLGEDRLLEEEQAADAAGSHRAHGSRGAVAGGTAAHGRLTFTVQATRRAPSAARRTTVKQ
jgi:DNA-directed RNA polymerase specialized sigma24 family protein